MLLHSLPCYLVLRSVEGFHMSLFVMTLAIFRTTQVICFVECPSLGFRPSSSLHFTGLSTTTETHVILIASCLKPSGLSDVSLEVFNVTRLRQCLPDLSRARFRGSLLCPVFWKQDNEPNTSQS